jgi:hypothetical protein
MQMQDISLIFKTKTFKIISALFLVWIIGFVVFLVWINPDELKTPGEPANFLRDFIWLFYWRWNLDYIMIPFWGLIVFIESWLFRKLLRRISKDTLSTWISPVLTMGFAYLYMLAIDLAVTFFADVGINGTWESPEIIWFGFTAQKLYHNFFFWLIPIIIICGSVNQVMIHKNNYTKSVKTWFVFMAIYSLNLGLLDPVVCQILWGDWTLFGSWAMGGADPIWAEGWIAHYIIFAILWILGTKLIENLRKQIIQNMSKRNIK